MTEFETQLLHKLDLLIAAMTGKQSALPTTKPKRESDDKEQTVSEFLGRDDLPWMDFPMPIGKEKGKPLRDVRIGFARWMADNWKPKGYRGDDDLQAMIAAITGGEEAQPEKEDEKDPEKAPETYGTGPDDGDDVPF